MNCFVEGEPRFQSTLFPETLDDFIEEDNSVRVIDARSKRGQSYCITL